MENLVTLFIAVTAAAVLLQAGILAGMYLAMRKSSARMEALADEVKTKALPTLETAQQILTELRPKLTLIADNLTETTHSVRSQVERMDATVDDVVDRARLQVIRADELLSRWRQADERINSYIAVGNYQAATQVALGTGEEDSTPAFEELEKALDNGIQESRRQLRDDILNARSVLSGATVGTVILSVVAAVAVTVGLWPRMSEYR